MPKNAKVDRPCRRCGELQSFPELSPPLSWVCGPCLQNRFKTEERNCEFCSKTFELPTFFPAFSVCDECGGDETVDLFSHLRGKVGGLKW